MRDSFKGKQIFSVAASPHEIIIFDSFRKRWMTFGNNYIQSAIYKRQPWKPLLYYIEPIALSLQTNANFKHCLILGMGGGALIHYLQHHYPTLHITAVEISSVIIELAQQYFGIKPSPTLQIINAAAEDFICTATNTFDVILVDLFTPQNYPASCATPAFFMQCNNLLAESGILSFNTVTDNASPDNTSFEQLLHKLRTHISKHSLCMPVANTSNIVVHIFKNKDFNKDFLDLMFHLEQRRLISHLQWTQDFGLMAQLR